MKLRPGFLTVLFAPSMAMAQVVHPEHVPAVYPLPGSILQEFVGVGAALPSSHQSIALFTLTAGTSYPESYNRTSDEIYLIHKGRGTVWLGDQPSPVQAGDIVRISPQLRHHIAAAKDCSLSFYAISAPSFTQNDYVPTQSR